MDRTIMDRDCSLFKQVFFKDGKEKISKLTVQVADEKKKVTAKEKILKTLQDEQPILKERKMLVDNYPEELGFILFRQ